MKFYFCNHCKNLVVSILDSGVTPVCCGEKMQEIIPGTIDASKEKHIPEVKIDGDKVLVEVGSVLHPMVDFHYIQFIVLEKTNGYEIKYLKPNEEPKAVFSLAEGEKVVACYEYCNLHGLWKKEL